MMEDLKGRLTVSIQDDCVCIEMEDETSGTRFIRATASHKDFMKALGRLSLVKMDYKLDNIERIGKKHEHKIFTFEMPDKVGYADRQDVAIKLVDIKCPAGWLPDRSFSSQGSFTQKDGVDYATTTIRRWV